MNGRGSLFAGLADVLTEMCWFYFVGALLVIGSDAWGVAAAWVFLPVPVSVAAFALLLRRERPLPVLAWFTAALIVLCVAFWTAVSSTRAGFGYILVMLCGAGLAVGRSLSVVMKPTPLRSHLGRLDVMVLALLAVFLLRESLTVRVDDATTALMVLIALLDVAAAVGLRMTEGGGGDRRSVFRAGLLSLFCAALVSGLVYALSFPVSGAGSAVGSALRAIGRFFKAVGRLLERFFTWLASLAAADEQFDALLMEEMPSMAGAEQAGEMDININPVPVIAVIGGLVLVLIVITVILLRRTRLRRERVRLGGQTAAAVTRERGFAAKLWKRLLAALRFRRDCFRLRNTPEGVFLYLERAGKRRRKPRGEGETMRSYIARVDRGHRLGALADALDAIFYRGAAVPFTGRECRKLRRGIRRSLKKRA